jgi:UDP-N-acetylmuramyl pentapeptide synthase
MAKVTDEELQNITALRETLIEIITGIGEQHLDRFTLEAQVARCTEKIAELEVQFTKFQQAERVLFEQLRSKYGTGNISIETGEIVE